jgi:hypothetical protein
VQALLIAGPKGLTILEMIETVNKFGLTARGLPWGSDRGKRGHLNQCIMHEPAFAWVGGSQTKGFIYAHAIFPGVQRLVAEYNKEAAEPPPPSSSQGLPPSSQGLPPSTSVPS